MPFPTYSSGTVSVDAGGTLVTGSGSYWSRTHARQGDLISIDGEYPVVILDVADIDAPEDDQEITIAAWQSGAKAAVPYAIFHTSIDRVLGRLAFEDVHKVFAALNAAGFPVVLSDGVDEPDVSDGDDDQFAIRLWDGSFTVWQKSGGVWVLLWSIADFADSVTDAAASAAAAAASEMEAAASAASASTSAATATTQATNAAASATAAAASATAAQTAETNAETAETNAETAEANAETAQAAAAASQTAAAASATSAAASAATATTQAGNAAASATAAAASATAAQTAETNAETAETNAETAETNAETAQAAAEGARDNAQLAETGAEQARDLAQEWADNDVGDDVTGNAGKYSAKHHSTAAQGFAAQAAMYAAFLADPLYDFNVDSDAGDDDYDWND